MQSGAQFYRYIMATITYNTGGVQWAGCCMLAPPNHGSSIARVFNKVGWLVAKYITYTPIQHL